MQRGARGCELGGRERRSRDGGHERPPARRGNERGGRGPAPDLGVPRRRLPSDVDLFLTFSSIRLALCGLTSSSSRATRHRLSWSPGSRTSTRRPDRVRDRLHPDRARVDGLLRGLPRRCRGDRPGHRPAGSRRFAERRATRSHQAADAHRRLRPALRGHPRAPALRVRQFAPRTTHWAARIPGSMDEFLAARSRERRRTSAATRGGWRVLGDDLEVRFFTSPDDLDRLYEDCERVHRHQLPACARRASPPASASAG